MKNKSFSICKYILISFIGVLIFFNILMFIRAMFRFIPQMSMLGDNVETLGFYNFWVEVLASLASFTMVFITAKTLEQNKGQLAELKRQWQEEHSPYLSCQLIATTGHFNLRIFNSSKVTADNVSISITNFLNKTEIFQFIDLQDFLKEHTFIIPPMESIYFRIWITPFVELGNLPSGYIEVSVKIKDDEFGTFKLYPQDYAFVSHGDNDSPIINGLEKIANKIKDQKVVLR